MHNSFTLNNAGTIPLLCIDCNLLLLFHLTLRYLGSAMANWLKILSTTTNQEWLQDKSWHDYPCFPALGVAYKFSRAFHWFHVSTPLSNEWLFFFISISDWLAAFLTFAVIGQKNLFCFSFKRDIKKLENINCYLRKPATLDNVINSVNLLALGETRISSYHDCLIPTA